MTDKLKKILKNVTDKPTSTSEIGFKSGSNFYNTMAVLTVLESQGAVDMIEIRGYKYWTKKKKVKAE